MPSLIEDGKLSQLMMIPLTIFTFFLIAMIYSKKTKKVKLIINEEELRTRLENYTPEPLASVANETYKEPNIPEHVTQSNNLCRSDYLCLTDSKEIKNIATSCIKKYGVGSCGPRGFYGTIDLHLDLETRIAEFMNLEETVLYSYSLSTMSSAIIAYCKKGDMLFCDDKLASSTIQSIAAAKSSVTFFKHNDVKDLEQKLIDFDKGQLNKKIKARKFLIIEGLYYRTGQMCPLVDLMKIREKYKLRMFLDESLSFGTIGSNGRGVTEHLNVDRTDIDLIVGSLEYGIPSIGGFCVGSNFVNEHQRLSGLGYCFSASLPPLHSAVAHRIIDMFETTPELFTKLHEIARNIHDKLADIEGFEVISHPLSPKKVLKLDDMDAETFFDKALKAGVLFNNDEENIVSFNVNIKMDDEYIDNLMALIKNVVQ